MPRCFDIGLGISKIETLAWVQRSGWMLNFLIQPRIVLKSLDHVATELL